PVDAERERGLRFREMLGDILDRHDVVAYDLLCGIADAVNEGAPVGSPQVAALYEQFNRHTEEMKSKSCGRSPASV
ncbi:MAG TPA: hypothetical protein VFC78_11095, partial [Tepidisphaeraceae bacterium]|nr:hypothetical protein [Tepidisphaeraceae bacterium]